MSGNSDATALVAAPSSEELYGRLQDSLHALGDGASALEETQRRLAEEQVRLTQERQRVQRLLQLNETDRRKLRCRLGGVLWQLQPPREAAPLWLSHLTVRELLRASAVARAWRSCVLETVEAWQAVTIRKDFESDESFLAHRKKLEAMRRMPGTEFPPAEEILRRRVRNRVIPYQPARQFDDSDLLRLLARARGTLHTLIMDSVDHITAAGLAPIREQPMLKKLRLGCRRVDVAQLTIPETVTDVSLVGCLAGPNVSDATLALTNDCARCPACRHVMMFERQQVGEHPETSMYYSKPCRRCNVHHCEVRCTPESLLEGLARWNMGCISELHACPACQFALCPGCEDRPSCFFCRTHVCGACVPNVFSVCGIAGCNKVGCANRVCAAKGECIGCDALMCSDCYRESQKCSTCDGEWCAGCAGTASEIVARTCSTCGKYECRHCVQEDSGKCHGCGAVVCKGCSMTVECCERIYCSDCAAKTPDSVSDPGLKAVDDFRGFQVDPICIGPSAGTGAAPVRNEAAKRLGLPRPIWCNECEKMVCADCVGFSTCDLCGVETCNARFCALKQCDFCGQKVCRECDSQAQDGFCCLESNNFDAHYMPKSVHIELHGDERCPAMRIWPLTLGELQLEAVEQCEECEGEGEVDEWMRPEASY